MREEDKIELRSEDFQEVLGYVPPWILRWGITLLGGIIVILLIGSAVIKYPDVISAPVMITGSVPPANITAHASGKLKQIFVTDKQQVNTGKFLAVIENPASTEDILSLKQYLLDMDNVNNTHLSLPEKKLQLGNMQALYATFYTTLFNYKEYERLLYYPQKISMTENRIVQNEKQYHNLLHQQHLKKEQLSLARSKFARDSLLNTKGVLSSEEFENSRNQYIQDLLSYESLVYNLNSMEVQIAQLKESLLDTQKQGIETLNELQSQIRSLSLQLKAEIEVWEINYVLKAPIDGVITFTNYWIENQNVVAGEVSFTIIPLNNDTIEGKASLPITRSGKVKAGQGVHIRLENFPENEYGILKGTVRNISLVPSQTGEQGYYTLAIDLPNQLHTSYKKQLPYMANMQGQADIITEDISLLERLFLPIKRIISERV